MIRKLSLFLRSAKTCSCNGFSQRFSSLMTQSIRKLSSEAKSMHTSHIDLNVVRKEFRKFVGGKISLKKDETNGVAYICLDHEDKKNAISGSMMVDLNEAITELEEWDKGKSLILHAKGDSFCSGGYLETVKETCDTINLGYEMSCLMHDSVIRLSNLPLVSVSIVQGKALGGGAELMLATDFRLFTLNASVSFVEAKMGVGTGWGGGTMLRRLLGPAKAVEILLSCRKITAENAISLGLANDYVGEKNSLKNAEVFLNRLVQKHDSYIVRTMKQIVNCDNFEKEAKLFAPTWGGPAHKKALNSSFKHE